MFRRSGYRFADKNMRHFMRFCGVPAQFCLYRAERFSTQCVVGIGGPAIPFYMDRHALNTEFFGELLQTISERGRALVDRTRGRRGALAERSESLVDLCE